MDILEPNERWIENVNSSEWLGLMCGSSCEPSAAAVFRIPFCTEPGKNGCGKLGVTVGKGAVLPSTPMRNAWLRSVMLDRHAPERVGAVQDTACKRPGPRSGTSIRSTPFKRP